MAKCLMCSDIAEIEIRWLAIPEEGSGEVAQNAAVCGACAAMSWEKISRNPRAASSFSIVDIDPRN